MNAQTPTLSLNAEKLEGMGCRAARRGYPLRPGQRQYVDGSMLAVRRFFNCSPHAHARIKKIDRPARPRRIAITAETPPKTSIAAMPTLAGDAQMVLADGKVLFQNQEVAFVAEDRHGRGRALIRKSNTSRCRSMSIRSR